MNRRRLLAFALVIGAIPACNDARPSDSPKPTTAAKAPPAPAVTQATFEPVYRASKAIQGATGPGVTYAKFGELLQGLSTEIAIAKDHQLNEADKKLLALYDDALTAYKFSAKLWSLKIEAHNDYWKDEIPVAFSGKPPGADVAPGLTQYGLVPENRVLKLTGAKYQALPKEAIQFVWTKADEILNQATEMYYGRSQAPVAATSKSNP
jgi:hypothetical protein